MRLSRGKTRLLRISDVANASTATATTTANANANAARFVDVAKPSAETAMRDLAKEGTEIADFCASRLMRGVNHRSRGNEGGR